MIGRVTGSTANDNVGSGGITLLTNGHFVVRSPNWDNGAATNAGGVTRCDGTTGCSGTVSAANSLVGSTTNDFVGSSGITLLTNGHFVVRSPNWDNGAATNAGAVTRCDGTTGCSGTVSAANSLVGSTPSGTVGSGGVTVLANSNYVVQSPNWGDGVNFQSGAATWCSGTGGCTGVVLATNSLTSFRSFTNVGARVVALTNGNFVVGSPNWDETGSATDAGAATWCDGTTGCSGTVSAANSLVGATGNDNVGSGIVALTNGNFAVNTPRWDGTPTDSTQTQEGAVTWCSGTTGCTGLVTPERSLVGTLPNSNVGSIVVALPNGGYVVGSPSWDSPGPFGVNKGAVTFCGNASGCTGVVSTENSLVGSENTHPLDGGQKRVGSGGISVLSNGNYVVSSPEWELDNLITQTDPVDAGAVTWCSGTTGCTGIVSISNSLIGSTKNDNVGFVTALTNGKYVVISPNWDNPAGAIANVGAATWGNGTGGTVGSVTASNSLVGGTANDEFGSLGATALADGNYVVGSSGWDNPSPARTDVGAVTWGNGAGGTVGLVTFANSLVGSTASDRVGDFGVTAFSDGNYVVHSSVWDNGATVDAGAVTLGVGGTGTTVGTITPENSVRGMVANGGSFLSRDYDATRNRLVVGRPKENIVTIFRPSIARRTPFDFDGDGRADLGVFRPSDSNWYRLNSMGGTFAAFRWGLSTDKLVPADYDGDARTDHAIYRDGTWWIFQSSNNQVRILQFGVAGDLLRPGDFDSDGKADICVFRPSSGTWYFLRSTTGQFGAIQFGATGDVPMLGDYDADGKTDFAVFRPSNGVWYIYRSSDNQVQASAFGLNGDIPLNGDFNGDGRSDLAVFRPSDRTWYVARPTGVPAQNFEATPFGLSTDTPVPADYDGDGKTDIAVYRGSGEWYQLRSSSGQVSVTLFGLSSDKPIPAAYDP